MPIIAALVAFGIVRFIGMGTGNKELYVITGGVCLVTGMALKQLGSVKGARKRLGQYVNQCYLRKPYFKVKN